MSPAISSSVRPSAAVRVMKPPTGPGRLPCRMRFSRRRSSSLRDFARHAHVFERRHVDHVASRQRDVRGDARALLAQRLLGDLNDDLLAFLQQIGDGRHPLRGPCNHLLLRTSVLWPDGFGRALLWPALLRT